MFKIHTVLAVAAVLTLGASMLGPDPAHAQLGNGSAAIGSSGEAIGTAPPATGTEDAGATPRAIGNCVTNRTAFRTQTNQVSTTSTTFVTMVNTHFPVTHQAGCLIVDFTGQVANSLFGANIRVRASIAGIGAAEPPSIYLGLPTAASVIEARSVRFVFPNVPAGTHTVKIEWSVTSGNGIVAERTLTVQYRQ